MKDLDAIDWTLGGLTLVMVCFALCACAFLQLDSKPRACTLTELIQRTSVLP